MPTSPCPLPETAPSSPADPWLLLVQDLARFLRLGGLARGLAAADEMEASDTEVGEGGIVKRESSGCDAPPRARGLCGLMSSGHSEISESTPKGASAWSLAGSSRSSLSVESAQYAAQSCAALAVSGPLRRAALLLFVKSRTHPGRSRLGAREKKRGDGRTESHSESDEDASAWEPFPPSRVPAGLGATARVAPGGVAKDSNSARALGESILG
jgi:hypothetical protein